MSSLLLRRQCHRTPSRWLVGRNIAAVAAHRGRNRNGVVMDDADADAAFRAINRPAADSIAIAAAQTCSSQTTHKYQVDRPVGRWMNYDSSVSWETRQQRANIFKIRSALTLQHSQLRCLSSSRHLPLFRDCQTMEEAVHMAHDNLDTATHRSLSAFWAVMPQLLQRRKFGRGENIEQVKNQLQTVLLGTLEEIGSFGYRDLAQTTLGFAKIVKNVGMKERRGSPYQSILHDLFIGGNDSENKQFIFDGLANASMHVLSKFDPRSLSNLIYAFGLAEHEIKFEDGSNFFDVLAVEAIPNLRMFKPQELSNVIWAYANVEAANSDLFLEAGDVIAARNDLEDCWPQALANIVWAYATADESHPKLFKKVAGHIVELDALGSFKPQELSNILWAYATADESHPMLFKKVADHIIALDNLGSFKPQNLSSIVWAYATADESHPKLFEKVADHIVALETLASFNGQNCANILWAYATADESHPMLFKKVADHIIALDNLASFNTQNLSNTVWAYATADESYPMLFKKVADHIIALDNLRAFNEQNLSNTVWAYATAKESNPGLFQKVAVAAIKRQHDFNSQGTANFLWAYAANGYIDKHLFQSLESTAASLLTKCNSQNLANIAWSYAVASVAAPSLFNADFINACSEKEDDFTLETLCQLHQWQLWQEEMKSNIRLPKPLQKKCYNAFLSRVSEISRLQDDVISELSSIGLQPEEEVLTNRGYRLDAIVEVNGSKVGIEVDGPTHFLGRKPTGSTILKHRQVTKLERIAIVSVPYWEWNKLKKDSKKKQEYLQVLLGLN